MESELMMMRRLLGMMRENEAQAQASRSAGGYNSGTQGSFHNSGAGSQNFRDVNYNSGSYSGNRYDSPEYYNAPGGNFVHNSGTTYGNGNGSIVNNGSPVPSKRNPYW
ncbi:uncharacterized protein LOC114711492 [Neltuma alba]|uniref:uncharacterized protein LOC114711492 n=1 Tax=Neltuma alba TaxID=207710 RepID=UPI0010A5668A|nr:uncharacterized protein LOC114711492 [Prosopis alba]